MRDEPITAEDASYQVGYGRPPLHTRFKAGQSGNPRGRPRSKRTTAQLLDEVLGETMWVTVNGRRKRVTVEAAIFYRLREQALKGDQRAIRLVIQMRAQAGSEGASGLGLRELLEEDLAILAGAGLVKGTEEADDGSA